MSKLILAAALAVSLAGCSKHDNPAAACQTPACAAAAASGGGSPSGQDGGPVQQK